MPIVPFSPREHGACVYSAFAHGSGEPRGVLDDLLDYGATCNVAVGTTDPSVIAGFAIRTPQDNTVAWVYVKPKARKEGLAKALVLSLGIDINRPVTALFFSPVIVHLKRRGYRIVPPKET